MKKNTYICNICRREHEDAAEVIGLNWVGQNVVEKAPPANSENHVCLPCLRAIRAMRAVDLARETEPAAK